MSPATQRPILVAHRRAPIQRVLRTNLEAEGFRVTVAASAGTCLNSLRTEPPSAIVLDAELIRCDSPDSSELLRVLSDGSAPTVLVSWDPADRLLARTLCDAPFISRPDNVDQVIGHVHNLIGTAVRR